MKRIVTILIFCAAMNSVFSQASDSSKTGTKVIFFGSNRTKEAKTYNGNAIKFGVADIAAGLYGLHWDHELSDIFSIQVGGGLTGHNYMEGFINDAFKDHPLSTSGSTYSGAALNSNQKATEIGDDNWSYANRSSNSGFFVEIVPKLFLTEDGFDGGYFGLNFQYRRYNYSADNVSPITTSDNSVTYTSSNPIPEYQNETIFAVCYGYQWTGEKTVVEEAFSLGLRNYSGMRRDVWNISTAPSGPLGTGSTTYYNVAQLSPTSGSQFYFEWTLKIGLWLGE